MSSLIISYQQHDQASVATSLFSQLKSQLPQTKVVGVSTLLNDQIISEVNSARALLVVIGDNWALGEWYNDIDDDDALAIKTGLNNPNVSVVPILINGASVPDDLPAPYSTLSTLPSFNLSSFNIEAGVQEIVRALQSSQKQGQSAPATSFGAPSSGGFGNTYQTAYQQPNNFFQGPQPPSSVIPAQQAYAPYQQQSSNIDPNVVLVAELIGGFFGFLGIGHMLTGEIGLGIMLLIGWWMWTAFVWVIVLLTLGLAGCLLGPLNIAAIIYSGMMARNTALRKQQSMF